MPMAPENSGPTMEPPDLNESIALTQQLLGSLITKPKLSSKLLAKAPVKFLRDIFVEVMHVTGFGRGIFSDEELENCWSTRDAKLSFLSALLHLVAHAAGDLALLKIVRVTKIAAGQEPENTNLLLQRLHYAANDDSCRDRWDFALKKATEPTARLPQDCILPPEALARKLLNLGVPRDRVVQFLQFLVCDVAGNTSDIANKVAHNMPGLDKEDKDEELVRAATKIQAQFRGQSARSDAKDMKKMASEKKGRRSTVCRQGYTINSQESILKYYEIESSQKLGEGSFGSVTTCRDKVSGNQYAVKTIAKSQVTNLEDMRKEIRMMQALDHPNMIKLFATFEDSRFFYLVMEVCSGGMLLDRIIADGHFNETKAAIVMSQIFRACHYLHTTVQMCHRDIKLENFLLSSKGEIDSRSNYLKMIDFGESKELGPQPLQTRVGTPFYVAPEVLNGSYNEKADMWSCGVCAYMLIAGYPPFPGTTPQEVTANVMTGQYAFHEETWADVSPDAKELISALLCWDPKERLSAQQALEHDWVHNTAPRAQIRRGQTLHNQLQNLKGFHSKNLLQKLAMNAVARSLNEKEIEDLKNLFVALDENGDGQLTIEELQAGMGQAGLSEAASKLASIIEECDADGDGMIAYTEFLAATVDRKRVIQEDVCWQAFRVFDMDGSGTIDKQELAKVLESEEVQEVLGIDSESLKEILTEVDQNGDGEIDFDEFMTMMRAGAGTA